jgi:hypothetical protein
LIANDTPRGDDTRRSAPELPRLTAAEDAELRQLVWFAQAGQLSEASQARLLELRARDRRDTVRDPRPDPGGGRIGLAPTFAPDPVGPPSACPNCGAGSLRQTGASRSCPYCGFSQRCDDSGGAAPRFHDEARLDEPEPRALGTVGKDAFRELLLNAVRGGPAADGRAG